MSGGAGNDWLEGSHGKNTMNGGAGEDVLASTGGKDTLTRGADADTFLFKDNSRGGTITDWEDAIDMIDLSRLDNVDGWAMSTSNRSMTPRMLLASRTIGVERLK